MLDYPLGATDRDAPAVVMANVLGAPRAAGDGPRRAACTTCSPASRTRTCTYYGKQERPGRKIGHVTVLGATMADVRERARLAAHWLVARRWLDGYDIHTGSSE